jgi:hypothetical protein
LFSWLFPVVDHAGAVGPLDTAALFPFVSIMRIAILLRHAVSDHALARGVKALSVGGLDQSRAGDEDAQGLGGDEIDHIMPPYVNEA